MTTEDDFQRQLDANPADHQTRLVFADWLEERGDPRAEGYRALGVLRRAPVDDYRPRARLVAKRSQGHGLQTVGTAPGLVRASGLHPDPERRL